MRISCSLNWVVDLPFGKGKLLAADRRLATGRMGSYRSNCIDGIDTIDARLTVGQSGDKIPTRQEYQSYDSGKE